jgi:hypothetical protein
MLLTGVTSAFLRSDSGTDVAAFNALWWPPTKVAGRYLSALLADVQTIGQPEGMFERRPADDLEGAARSRAEMRALALEMATTDAQWEDYGSAARWLQTIEWLDGALPADLALRRDQWLARAAAGS